MFVWVDPKNDLIEFSRIHPPRIPNALTTLVQFDAGLRGESIHALLCCVEQRLIKQFQKPEEVFLFSRRLVAILTKWNVTAQELHVFRGKITDPSMIGFSFCKKLLENHAR